MNSSLCQRLFGEVILKLLVSGTEVKAEEAQTLG